MAPTRSWAIVVLSAVLAAPCAAETTALRRQKELRTMSAAGSRSRAAEGRATMWPFDSSSWPFGSNSASAHGAKQDAVTQASPDVRESIEDVKDRVMLTQAFGQKTAKLCTQAPPEDTSNCRRLAGERLFCALLDRHSEKYQGLVGVAAEKEKCATVDIMENAVEAAKDERDQQEAAKA
eukprot:CAMPEP_0115497514 /NCGR_PEP_ID=MMETSP0271-20121206/66323_1 /TAXON_ID=71861 /ORGANISM="Scrippsiella trochoidea, Strain CCMP3099" /LENGTH=178 /DNA_ID=CAMNT_0002926223 /DNA_START=85 /DNA_END=621 /DNA_ORIENTATION=+